MNSGVITGNLVYDPQLTTLQSGTKVVNFVLASGRKYTVKSTGQEVDERVFLDCEAWDSGAETICSKFKKGDPIELNYSLKMDNWERDGKKYSKVKLRVNNFAFPPSKRQQAEVTA